MKLSKTLWMINKRVVAKLTRINLFITIQRKEQR
jgi:hypothetical protein